MICLHIVWHKIKRIDNRLISWQIYIILFENCWLSVNEIKTMLKIYIQKHCVYIFRLNDWLTDRSAINNTDHGHVTICGLQLCYNSLISILKIITFGEHVIATSIIKLLKTLNKIYKICVTTNTLEIWNIQYKAKPGF